MKYTTYFSQNTIAILQLNQAIKRQNSTQSVDDNNEKWKLINVGKYVHPATFDWIAEILGLEKNFCFRWLMDYEDWSHDAEHFAISTEYFALTHLRHLEAALAFHKNHPLMIENQLSPEDFIWEIVPILPDNTFEYRVAKNGTNQLSVAQVILQGIKRRENAAQYLAYKTGYRTFQALLAQWIAIVNQPNIATLWELPPYHQFMLSLENQPKPHYLKECLPHEIMLIDDDRLKIWNYEVIPISKQYLLQVNKNRLKVIEIQSFKVVKEITLPFYHLQFYKKEKGIVYFLIEEGLICWHIERQDFIKSERQHPYIEFSEVTERSYLSNSQYANVIGLSEICDYPVVNEFDVTRNYFWGEDKEGSGGVYSVQSGLLEVEPNLVNIYAEEEEKYEYATSSGEIVSMMYVEEEDEYEIYRSLKKQAELQEKILKPNCFGFYKGDWLFYYDNRLIYKNEIRLITQLVATYAMFDSETEQLYVENPNQIQVFDLQNLDAIKMIQQATSTHKD